LWKASTQAQGAEKRRKYGLVQPEHLFQRITFDLKLCRTQVTPYVPFPAIPISHKSPILNLQSMVYYAPRPFWSARFLGIVLSTNMPLENQIGLFVARRGASARKSPLQAGNERFRVLPQGGP